LPTQKDATCIGIHVKIGRQTKKKRSKESKMDLTCCGHAFTTAQSLKRHKESTSHRRLTDQAAVTAADEVFCSVCDFFCSVCDTGHDFKTLQNLKQHEKRASHKRKLDPEFAAAEEAEKAAKKAARDTKETARLKETDKLRKRRRTKAEKELASKERQRIFYAKLKSRNTAPPITETGTEEDVLSALVRYHG
jgi:hypothetical protein